MARLIVILDPTDLVQGPEHGWAKQRGVVTAILDVPNEFLYASHDMQRVGIDRLLDTFLALQRQ